MKWRNKFKGMIAIVDGVYPNMQGDDIAVITIPVEKTLYTDGKIGFSVNVDEIRLANKAERFLFEMNREWIINENRIKWEE